MNQPRNLPRSGLGPLVLIAAIVGGSVAAFAYTAGWFSPQRLTPEKMVDALTPPSGVPLGHRRNHAKGICFTGVFEANGTGCGALAAPKFFAQGQYPALGRFNLGTPNPDAADATVRVRGMGLLISTTTARNGAAAMINPPVFPVSTPQAFHELLLASASKDPNAMKTFARRQSGDRRVRGLGQDGALDRQLCGGAVSTASTASSSPTVPAASTRCDGRCCRRRNPVPVSQADLAKRGPDFLEQEITERVRTRGPQRWTMVVTVANPGDPTADPSKAWPEDRRTVEVGTLIVQRIEAERDGPCRDINFDPTVLPTGHPGVGRPVPGRAVVGLREIL